MAFFVGFKELSDTNSKFVPEPNDKDLIAEVLEGSAESFEPLVVKYQSRIFALARRYARREDEVEDIVQTVFLKAYSKLSSYRGDAPFEHWLMRTATYTCYDFLTKTPTKQRMECE